MNYSRARGYAARVLICLVAFTMCSQGSGYAAPSGAASSASGWAQATLRRMTLREKVGQMFVASVYGQGAYDTSPAMVAANRRLYGVDNAARLIARYHVGGIILFSWANNMNSVDQVARMSNGIQHAGRSQRVPVPLLISTDQEQGIIYRLPPPTTAFPGSMPLGAGRNPANAWRAAYVTGQEMRAMGLNQDMAPDADVNVNPQNPIIGVRSFGSYPPMVSSLTEAQVRGFQHAGVAATAKHFPGHGDTDTDSHTGLPVIHHTRAQLKSIDLPPFRAAISSGVDAIMTAHIVVPALDASGRPATLSRPILTGVLRRQLGFRGVIITDSLSMAGVRQMFSDRRVPVEAIKAGADLMLMPPDLRLAIDSVMTAVYSGEISRARIDQSVLRILQLKAKLDLHRHPYVDRGVLGGIVGTRAHRRIADGIANRSITLVKNSTGRLPLKSVSGKRVLVTGWGVQTTAAVARQMSARGVRTYRLWTGAQPSSSLIDQAVRLARQRDLVVVTTQNVASDRGQRALVKALVATRTPVVVVAVWNPYDIAYFPGVRTYVATYGYSAVSLRALARVLFGEVNSRGKLPVRIPVSGRPTATLYRYGYGLSYR